MPIIKIKKAETSAAVGGSELITISTVGKTISYCFKSFMYHAADTEVPD